MLHSKFSWVWLLLFSLCVLSLNADEIKLTQNNLDKALSPYLQQHVDNPIHWQQWDESILLQANKLNKPIFLSIGYASCHWCHVMERESFLDDDVAEVLNSNFINIKVDREERPDIDAIYMLALQLMKGEGGWPLNAFLTPEGEVFFVDSYLSREKLITLGQRLGHMWESNAAVLTSNAKRLSQQMQRHMQQSTRTLVGVDTPSLHAQIIAQLDGRYGGLLGTPKFPNETLLSYLLDVALLQGDEKLLISVIDSLQKMATSALFDPVSGGFYRYSVDAQWKEPHFEKMLYNQALLVDLYSRAYATAPHPLFKQIVEKTIAFVQQELQAQELYFSSMDADSNHQEGAYYLFSYQEIQKALPAILKPMMNDLLDVSIAGNFQGKNILRFKSGWQQRLYAKKITPIQGQLLWQQSLNNLFIIRQHKTKPFVDEKAITGWNALWIKALWQAANIFANDQWQQQALQSQNALLKVNARKGVDAQLVRFSLRGRQGNAKATLEDYSFVISMLLMAYDVSADIQHLLQAETFFQQMTALFYDEDASLWRPFQSEQPLANASAQSLRDENFPNAYAMVLLVAKQLQHRTGDLVYLQYSQAGLAHMSQVTARPQEYALALQAQLGRQLIGQQYFADGHGKVHFYVEQAKAGMHSLVADITMQQGWHINSDRPGSDKLIATQFFVNDQKAKNYPLSQKLKVSFNLGEINIWQGRTRLRVEGRDGTDKFELKLTLQACSDAVCLAPETLEHVLFDRLNVPVK